MFGVGSVQFHPEHMAGPQDLEVLFDVFLEQVMAHKQGETRFVYTCITKMYLLIKHVLGVCVTILIPVWPGR